jgi:hypothetical protein
MARVKKASYAALIFLISLSLLYPHSTQALPKNMKQVTVSLMLDFNPLVGDDFDNVYAWIKANPANWTLVIDHFEELNSTQINLLQSQGECIPVFAFLQTLTPKTRLNEVNSTLEKWQSMFGSLPEGIFSFMPDTLVNNYILNIGLKYVIGYCFDQYTIDFMTERGGWQLPYYASTWHTLAPNNETNGGLIVYPHSTWDWLDSFNIDHAYQTHPMTIANPAEQYCADLITQSLENSSPFGYTSFMFEHVWVKSNNKMEIAESVLSSIRANSEWNQLTVSDFTRWFIANYAKTPTYRVNGTGLISGDSIEWFYSKDLRVARVGSNIVSYVSYIDQSEDVYLTSTASIDFEDEHNLHNCIDNSLSFTVDALGGAQNRAPITTKPFSYPVSEDLSKFSEYYYRRTNEVNVSIIIALFFAYLAFVVTILIIFLRQKYKNSENRK